MPSLVLRALLKWVLQPPLTVGDNRSLYWISSIRFHCCLHDNSKIRRAPDERMMSGEDHACGQWRRRKRHRGSCVQISTDNRDQAYSWERLITFLSTLISPAYEKDKERPVFKLYLYKLVYMLDLSYSILESYFRNGIRIPILKSFILYYFLHIKFLLLYLSPR